MVARKKVIADGVYEIEKRRRNFQKQAAAKIWLSIPTPPPDSSLGGFWRERHRSSGATVLSSEEGRSPRPLEEVHQELSPPTGSAQSQQFLRKGPR